MRLTALFILAFTVWAWAAPVKVTLSVPGMTWASCPSRVREIVSKQPSVKDVSTDKIRLTVSFTYDDEKVKIDQILEQLDKQSNGRYAATVKE